MLATLSSFVDELRRVGIPVSITEHLDAATALTHIPLDERAAFKAALAATLVKHDAHRGAFETVFEVWFSLTPTVVDSAPGGNGDDDLVGRVAAALASGDVAALSELARLGVARHADIRSDRRLGGGSYELYRTLRSLELDATLERLLAQNSPGHVDGSLDERLRRDELRHRARRLRQEVDAEVRRRLVAERGAEAMAAALRRPLPVDVEFMHASRDELAQLRRCLHPLTRALAARLTRRRRHRHRGRLDIRATVRHSLGTGGVPIEPRFRRSHPAKPEIWVVADISGSVAAFARFTLALVHAISSQFSAVRSFAFIDGVDEVTQYFGAPDDFAAAVRRVNAEADVVAGQGHSDYGAALEAFLARYGSDVGPRTTVLVLGDARSNYHDGQPWVLEELARSARHLYWLNPEPRAYWDTGDSVMGAYAAHCDGVFECRNLRQLGRFVEVLA
ncbi:MAG TPA: VWA domain-containing protein [Acidimicrobiales bacterium]|nr:VWA domain-containing protein [Acidimicrobiales bacterium]